MLITVACYLLQLYADFSGYTNIALGVGKLFGVEGPPNFNAPFAAVNIQEILAPLAYEPDQLDHRIICLRRCRCRCGILARPGLILCLC